MMSDQELFARGRSAWLCMDCGKDTYESQEYFMLRNKLWKAVHSAVDGMLCLACTEVRLGRPLTKRDFAPVPVNTLQARVCPELAQRMTRVRA